MSARGRARGDDGGRLLVRLERASSTNDEVRSRWASSSARSFPHLSSVVTLDQTGGRGRLGRAWTSPAGAGFAVSTILRLHDDERIRASIGWLGLAAGLALRSAAADELGADGDRVAVKWPNDVLVDDRKLAGILGEVLGTADGELACVVGTGVNVSLTEAQLPVPTATSLAIATGRDVDGQGVLDRYLAEFTRRIDALVRADGDAREAGLVAEIERTCSTLGRRVRVALPGDTVVVGDATGITDAGNLLVRDDAGIVHTVTAGDVQRVRPDGIA